VQKISEARVVIEQSCMDVYDYISNMENFGQWFPEVISIKSKDTLPNGQQGKVYAETVKIPFKGTENIQLSVSDAISGKFFSTIGDFYPLLPKMEISLKENDNGHCIMTWRMLSRNDKLSVRIFILPFAKLIMQKRAYKGLRNLKEILESETNNPILV